MFEELFGQSKEEDQRLEYSRQHLQRVQKEESESKRKMRIRAEQHCKELLASLRAVAVDKILDKDMIEHIEGIPFIRRDKIYSCLPIRRATPAEYAAWARGYLAGGGTINYHRNRNMGDDVFLAKRSFKLPNLYGADSITLIVPAGLNVQGTGGHSVILYMDGFKSSDWVEMFNDVAQLI